MLPGIADAAEDLDALVRAGDRGIERDHGGDAGGELLLAIGGRAGAALGAAASQTAAAACSAAISIRAQRCLTAWNWPIGRPNWWRILAYSEAVCTAQSAMPQASAPKRIAARLVTDSRVRPGSSRSAGTVALSARTCASERVRSRLSSVVICRLAASTAAQTSPSAVWTPAMTRSAMDAPSTGPDSPLMTRAPSAAAGAGQARGQRHRAGAGTVGQADEQLARHPGRHQDRAGQHGRQERSGDQGPAQLLEGHGEFRQAVTLAAVLIGHVQAQHSLLAQAGREGLLIVRGAAVRPIGGGSHDLRRAVALRPSANRFRELQMFFGQAERHRPPRSPGSFSKMATF